MFHNVPLNFVVFQDCQSPIDEYWRRGGLKVGSKVWGWPLQHEIVSTYFPLSHFLNTTADLHVHGGDFQRDGLEFSQKIEVHEILLQ